VDQGGAETDDLEWRKENYCGRETQTTWYIVKKHGEKEMRGSKMQMLSTIQFGVFDESWW